MAEKWQALEEEMKLLKNEIKQVLIDIKERIDNPSAPPTLQSNVKKVSLSSWGKAADEELKVEPTTPKLETVDDKSEVMGTKMIEDEHTNGNGNVHGKANQDLMGTTIKMGNVPGPNGNGFHNSSPFGSQPVTQSSSLTGKPSTDLVTVAMLSRWLANGVKKVGRQRMEVLVDIYSQLGGFPPTLRDAMMKLLNTDDGDGQSMNEGVSLLIEVDNLMQRSLTDKNEAAILSLFLNGNGKNGNGREVSHR